MYALYGSKHVLSVSHSNLDESSIATITVDKSAVLIYKHSDLIIVSIHIIQQFCIVYIMSITIHCKLNVYLLIAKFGVECK